VACPIESATSESLRETTHSVLAGLTPRETTALRKLRHLPGCAGTATRNVYLLRSGRNVARKGDVQMFLRVVLSLFLYLSLFASCARAQTPDPAALAEQLGPQAAQMMQKMQSVQEQYQREKETRAAERRTIADQVAREELERAERNAASLRSQGIDPLSAAEVATRERMTPLQEQWKLEDAELDAQMQAKMQQAMAEVGLVVPVPAQ